LLKTDDLKINAVSSRKTSYRSFKYKNQLKLKMELARVKQTLRALKSKNFRLFFFGQGISLIGTWMTQVAAIWLVYRLTNSPLLLGILAFVSQSPGFFAPVAGSLIDRLSKHQVLLVIQTLAMIRSLVLAFLTLSNLLNIWQLVILSFLQGLINAIDLPARQAFLPEIVEDKKDLSNAIALSAAISGLARLLGPALAGLLTASVGAGICFLVDGISYIAVLTALLMMQIPLQKSQKATFHKSFWHDLIAGMNYAWSLPSIRSVLLLLALVNFMGTPFIALGPIFARDILGGSSSTFGFIMTISAIGALIGTIYLSSRSGITGIEHIYCRAANFLGISLIIFAQSRILWLSLIAIAFTGCFLIIANTGSNTILLTITEEDKRGRVMGLYTLASDAIMIPCGNLFAGILARFIGAPNTMIFEGICCLIGSFLFVKQLPLLKQALSARS
jgi:MFS family permease